MGFAVGTGVGLYVGTVVGDSVVGVVTGKNGSSSSVLRPTLFESFLTRWSLFLVYVGEALAAAAQRAIVNARNFKIPILLEFCLSLKVRRIENIFS